MTHNPIITKEDTSQAALQQWLGDAGHTRYLVVADNNTVCFAAPIIRDLPNVRLLTLAPATGQSALVPDELAIGKIFIAASNVQAIISVGSGTLCDLVRYVSFRLGLPYYIVATAASMDGYKSSVAALIVGGIKQTYPAAAPAGVIADPDIYERAPAALASAGFGDIMGKFTSVADWEMEELICPEAGGFCKDSADMMRRVAQECYDLVAIPLLRHPGLEPESPGISTAAPIMDALMVSGGIMQKVGNSKPASGGEHHLSHFWEMNALLVGKPPVLHGAKVGVATLVALKAQEWLLAETITDAKWAQAEEAAVNFIPSVWQEEIRCVYAAPEEILALWVDETPDARVKLVKRIRENWPAICKILSQNAGLYPKMKLAIKNMNGPTTPACIGVDRETFIAGVLHANKLRRRFTIWRLLDLLGLLPGYAERLAGFMCDDLR